MNREEIVAMLATFRERRPEEVGEQIDSLELAWLVHQVEQRYGVALADHEDDLARISSVSDAVDILGDLLGGRVA
jgi:acyl carrier protein